MQNKIKLCNIYPIENQSMYKNEKNVMILAHLADKYDPENFKNAEYIIMDNGLFEKSLVSTNIKKLIRTAEILEEKGIHVNEIVIPDALFDGAETVRLFKKNRSFIAAYGDKYKFMFVLQAKDIEEFCEVFNYINRQKLNLSIGVTKLAKYDRYSEGVVNVLRNSNHPIHFLGLKNNFKELEGVSDFVRSCDSSQISYLAQKLNSDQVDGAEVSSIDRDESKGLINLAEANLSNDTLESIRNKVLKEMSDYVIL